MTAKSKQTHLAPEADDRPRFGFTDQELATRPSVFHPDLFKDQVFVVSGGGSGIGKAISFLLARLGADVVICGRRAEKLRAAHDALRRLTGKEVMTQSLTIRDPEAVTDLFDRVADRYGRLDGLVNNAGGQFPQDAIDFSIKGWNAVIDTNLNGTWWMMQAAARLWRSQGKPGQIINIVANVERGMPQAAHTCAARAGVIYLSKTVSTEWAPLGIRVNCVAPGVIETEGFAVYPDEALTRFHEANPMKTRGDAWDIAQSVAYLAAPSGKFITGEVLTIDGGMQQWGVVWPAGMPSYFATKGGA